MSYYKTWIDRSETVVNKQLYTEYIKKYYSMEEKAYKTILGAYPDNKEYLEGNARTMASKLGFDSETMDIFVGFLDGIKTSLKNSDALDLENVDDDTEVKLDIDYEKLFYNMLDAKADWLYKMPEWKNILEEDLMKQITHDYRVANMAHSDLIGRNDPCPCGSGKKYKNCCGKKN